jgi:CHAT domain-containing protein
MDGFRRIIADLHNLPKKRVVDSLLYQAYYKLGVLYEVYKDYSKATASYLQAINFSATSDEKFMNYVLAGGGYYNQNNFDSATYFLLHAEQTEGKHGSKEDRVRLYNTLGVLYYDNGNYLQSKNYFGQALQLLESKNLTDTYSLQLNIAACFYKLGLYNQALAIYQKIVKYHLLNDPLFMNMGRTYRSLHQYEAAMSFFKRVKVSVSPNVLNEMARTALESGNAVAAAFWLEKYRKGKQVFHTNALDDGENEIYSGDLDIYHSDPESALRHLQSALIIFSRNYFDKDPRKNPVSFTGSFAYYRLFEVMVKKAHAWEMKYEKTSRPEDLRSAYETYQSTMTLLSYIERSYEMDDAKILLKQKSGEVYTKALKVSLQLDKIYPKQGFQESAFFITEKNKASVMSSQIREKSFLEVAGTGTGFEREERNIKFNIARLNSKAEERTNAKSLQIINNEKSDYETQLANLHRKMEMNSRFYQLKYSDDFPVIQGLQSNLTTGQALISFYNTPDKIEIFVLTGSGLNHIELDCGDTIRTHIQAWIQEMYGAGSGRHMKMKWLRKTLFTELMKPLIAMAGDKEEWIIVPDGIFFLLPFESLPENAAGKPVMEDHVISYEFSARFIINDGKRSAARILRKPILSFAPFSRQGAKLKSGGAGFLEKLPFSNEETEGLSGKRFADSQATKDLFMKNFNRFPIVHLATHAMTDLENPSASFIAFYPATGIRSEDFLFLDEIYSLNMDSCQMMVISACETGRGELVHNEGVMSFARAFLYAGCPSTINTLWKADDRSTSEIIRLFYKYLEDGETKSRALQKAKLEFIRNNPLYRDPAYWSHIVLTGDPGALYKKKQPWIWAAFAIVFSTILFFFSYKSKNKKVDAFHS